MSDIDAIIQRSRAKGGFKKRGYFTLASQKAKIKVSEYALPNPYYFCLEFIQSAVAIGAIYVDVSSTDSDCTIAFEGAHFTRKDLEYLFDFLVTDREETHFRARRRLGIGIASALSLAGASVAIESGDGTPEGSTRFELGDIAEAASIGEPPEPIRGCFIKVARPASRGVYGPNLEDDLINERCLHLPINFRLNGEVTFSPGRTLGPDRRYRADAVRFDEGDLYGWIHREARDDIKLVTDGVWIDSIRLPRPYAGGVVGYERLHKTASQYAVAHDDRIEELKQRLKPHVDELLRGELTDARRLKFLCDKPKAELTSVGKPYTFDVVDGSGARWAKARFRLCPSLEQNCLLNVMHSGNRNRVDAVTIPYEFPVVGELVLDELTLGMIRFRRPGDHDFMPMYTVGLTPDVYQRFYRSAAAERDAMFAHFEREAAAHLEQRQETARPAEAVAEPETEGLIDPAGQEEDQDADRRRSLEQVVVSAGGEAMADTEAGGLIDLARLKWLGGLDGEGPDTFIPDLLHEATRLEEGAEPPQEPEVVAQPDFAPPPPFPTFERVKSMCAAADTEVRQDETLLYLVARVLSACLLEDVPNNTYEGWRSAIRIVRAPGGAPVWSAPAQAAGDEEQPQQAIGPLLGPVGLILNPDSELVRDCLTRAAVVPESFYTIPILVFHEYRRAFLLAEQNLDEITLLRTILDRIDRWSAA